MEMWEGMLGFWDQMATVLEYRDVDRGRFCKRQNRKKKTTASIEKEDYRKTLVIPILVASETEDIWLAFELTRHDIAEKQQTCFNQDPLRNTTSRLTEEIDFFVQLTTAVSPLIISLASLTHIHRALGIVEGIRIGAGAWAGAIGGYSGIS